MATSNRFYYQPRDATTASPVEPRELSRSGEMHRRWLFGVLAELDALLPEADLDVLVTWDLNTLEDRFRGCVAVVYDDDQLQTPLWAPGVALIFKNTGLGRESLGWTLRLPPAIAWRMAIRDARNFALGIARGLKHERIRGPQPPTFQFPFGPSALVDAEYIPFDQRSADLFFAGSVHAAAAFTLRPKVVARRQMDAALEKIAATDPELVVDYRTFEAFGVHFGQDERILSTDEYVRRMSDSRFALCPRGNVEETYRVFEAARLGCVAISEPLPRRWYFSDIPYVKLRRWSQLPDVVRELRRDEAAGAAVSEAARTWYEERIAQPQIAAFMQHKLLAARVVPAINAGRRSGSASPDQRSGDER